MKTKLKKRKKKIYFKKSKMKKVKNWAVKSWNSSIGNHDHPMQNGSTSGNFQLIL